MNKYWKAWGALVGAAVGVVAAYGLVPDGAESQVTTVIDMLGPVIGATIGTWLAPKNAG
jgi:hypothetical protein